jgi:2,3-bisphosphoglycerate-independent phosphoglycerate mutase
MKTRYALLVGDGMADYPVPQLGNKTPLAYAATPNMDTVARQGSIGMVSTIPEGMPPGSDVANMSLMGYDPAKYYSGRAPIEAASLGVALSEDDVAFRCNLVTLKDALMADYSAGHIATEEARLLITELSKELTNESVHFYPGVSYRHLVVINGIMGELECTPPHDISDQEYGPHLPKGPGSDILVSLMERAHAVLASSLVNKRRYEAKKPPATDIWLWGQGRAVVLPALRDSYAIEGTVISAVDLIRGLGILAGLKAPVIPGATGYLGTNYAGKIAAAQDALRDGDFVYLHVEAPDETSHEGSLEKKITAIEEFDKNIVGEMLRIQNETEGLKLLVAPDHATPVSTKTHAPGPVPYAMCGQGVAAGGYTVYTEEAAKDKNVLTGVGLFELFIRG